MRCVMRKIAVYSVSFLMLLLLTSGIPRLIGGETSENAADSGSVPALQSELTAAVFPPDIRTDPETEPDDSQHKAPVLLQIKTGLQEKTGRNRMFSDSNGNPLNPYHGRYQVMVYRIFAPEKGFV